jgi:hypothetical protein
MLVRRAVLDAIVMLLGETLRTKLFPTGSLKNKLYLGPLVFLKLKLDLSPPLLAQARTWDPPLKASSRTDLPPKIRSKTNVRIGPIRRQKQWQEESYFQQNRSS